MERHGIGEMVLSLAGTFIGLPAAFCFLAAAMYGNGDLRFWILGLGSLAFGLWGMWRLVLIRPKS